MAAVGKQGPTVSIAGLKQRYIFSDFCLPIEPNFLAKVFQTVALFTRQRQTIVLLYGLDGLPRIES